MGYFPPSKGGDGTLTELTSTGDTITITDPNGPVTNIEVTPGTYAPTANPAQAIAAGAKNQYDPATNLYNVTSANMLRYRTALANALAGKSLCKIALIGDSVISGVTASTGDGVRGSGDVGTLLMSQMNARFGLPSLGTGIAPALGQQTDPRWLTATNWTPNPPYAKSTGSGASMEFSANSGQVGTAVRVYYLNASAVFAVSIDGASAVTVTPTGSGLGVYEVDSLSNTTHTITITAAVANAYIVAVEVGYPSSGGGITVANYGVSGSITGAGTGGWETTGTTVAAGSNGANVAAIATLSVSSIFGWPTSGTNFVGVPTSTGFALFSFTGATGSTLTGLTLISGSGTLSTGTALQSFNVFPWYGYPTCLGGFNMVGIGFGASINDWDTNVTPAQSLLNVSLMIRTLQALPSPPSVFLIIPASPYNGSVPASPANSWSSFVENGYLLADQFSVPLIDLNDRWALPGNTDAQNWTRANGMGLMTTANPFHPSGEDGTGGAGPGYQEQTNALLNLLAPIAA